MLFYYKNKNVGSVTCSRTPTFIVEPFFYKKTITGSLNFQRKLFAKTYILLLTFVFYSGKLVESATNCMILHDNSTNCVKNKQKVC